MAKTRRQKGQKTTVDGGDEGGLSNHATGNPKLVKPSFCDNLNEPRLNPVNGESAPVLNPPSNSDELETPSITHNDAAALNSWINALANDSCNPLSNNIPDNPNGISATANMVSIELDDIEDEINYWSTAMVCYVMGANPPFSVMNGFCRRIWGKSGLDKVSLVGRGLFLVRFNTSKQCHRVLDGDPVFFDSRPVIIKQWEPDMELHKDTVKTVPIWIRFPKLHLKYWGSKCLHKLGDSIGSTLRVDQLTLNRERLAYARILVEIALDKPLPDKVMFQNEKGLGMEQVIEYEWKPVQCTMCKKYGHDAAKCKGAQSVKQIWQPKQPVQTTQHQLVQKPQLMVVPTPKSPAHTKGNDRGEFTPVQGMKAQHKTAVVTPIYNSFSALSSDSEEACDDDEGPVCGEQKEEDDREVTLPNPHG